MLTHRADRLLFGLMVAIATLNMAVSAEAQEKKIKIGVIYDLTGPFAAGGSVASSVGAQIAIDLVNEKGGIGGKYKIAAVAAGGQL